MIPCSATHVNPDERNNFFFFPLDIQYLAWYHSNMKRTTQEELINSVRTLNREMGFPDDGATAIGVGQIPGSFHLQGAYGGFQLQRFVGTGVESVTTGYRPKRELKELVDAMVHGIALHRAYQMVA